MKIKKFRICLILFILAFFSIKNVYSESLEDLANELSEIRLLIACFAGSFIAFLGRRMRSRAQVLQIALFIPFGALLGQWFIFNQVIC